VKIDRVGVATAVSWLGLWVHELYRVPRLLEFTPDGDLFMLPSRCPVRLINDAAMAALGSYKGGRMLFLGLGTG
jgi:hypothetical protein